MSQRLVKSDSMYSDLSKEIEMLWDQQLKKVYGEFTHAKGNYPSGSFPNVPEISISDDQQRAKLDLILDSFQTSPVDHGSFYYDEENKNSQYKATWDLRESRAVESETRPKYDIYAARLDLTKSGTSSTTDDSDFQSCTSVLSAQCLQDLDSDSTVPVKQKVPKFENEKRASGNKAAGQNPNTDVLFVSACLDLLFVGKDAEQLLGCVLRHFNKNSGNRSFPVIKVKGESVPSLQGVSLQAQINAAILNSCESTPVFILILENFNEEQICYLYESGFVRETMQAPSRRAHVIFLCSSYLKNLKKIARYGPKVVKADFAEWFATSKSKANTQSSYDGGPIITEMDAEESRANSPVTVRMKESRSNNHVPNPIIYQPISALFEEKIKMALLNSDLLEMKSRYSESVISGNSDATQNPPPTEMEGSGEGDKPKEKATTAKGKCMDWYHGIYNVFSTVVTQCADCCFY